ncbi:MAG TPA: patatin-like phospholipase family protein [Terriglobales bacterium]|nr:patatin-like phospholipase family protein [Terriglobales bacterium]
MAYKIRTRDEHFLNDGTAKRILALDGGGLRGILTLSYLAEIESVLRERHGGSKDFRLHHYFDLIAGTSTGSIIAAALARGMAVADIIKKYNDLGQRVFQKSWLRQGYVRAFYDEAGLINELKEVYGADTTMGDESLHTGLLVITKRLDSASPWPISNNPRGRYFGVRPNQSVVPNSAYPLWQVVRASTAAPRYFDPERIVIAQGRGAQKSVQGEFVDGGVSPFNNPALQALMYVTFDGYGIGWPLGADKILLVSVGTGSRDPQMAPANLAMENAVKALISVMDDCADLMEIVLQWMSSSRTARVIDREMGDLHRDSVAPAPLITYSRYNIALTKDSLTGLGMSLPDAQYESLSAMDDPANMATLQEVGARAAKRQILGEDFPASFDLAG